MKFTMEMRKLSPDEENIKCESVVLTDEIDMLSNAEDLNHETSNCINYVKIERLTDERDTDYENAAENLYDVLIDIEDMKMESNDDGTASRQCEQISVEDKFITNYEIIRNKPRCKTDAQDKKYTRKANRSEHRSKHSEIAVKKRCHDTNGPCTAANVDNYKKYLHEEFICDYCCRKFNKKYLLREHIKEHHKIVITMDNPYKCAVCEKRFITKGSMIRHVRTHTEEHKTQKAIHNKKPKKSYSCIVCQRISLDKTKLRIHSLIHTGEKPFECTICQHRFGQKGHLNRHKKRHTGEKPFQCPICQRKFRQKYDMNTHLIMHTGEKSFQCSICERKFGGKGSLTLHMRTHTGEKPFECAICQRKFTCKQLLVPHLTLHSDEKRFECVICERKFSLKKGLVKHLKTHNRDKPFHCINCGRRFSHKYTLSVHLKTHSS